MQQVNLYQITDGSKNIVLPFRQIVQGILLFVLILAGTTGYLFITHYKTKIAFAELKRQEENLSVSLLEVESSVSSTATREELVTHVQTLTETKSQREQMHATLKRLQSGGTQGFARYFAALSKYSVPGLWLTDFKILSQGGSITITGQTKDVAYVPKLIQRLAESDVFRGKTFGVFNVAIDEKSNFKNFTLETE